MRKRGVFRNAQETAHQRWGRYARLRTNHTGRGKSAFLCEVGIGDPDHIGPPWPRPMIVFGSGTSFAKAFADADQNEYAMAYEAQVASERQAT